MSPQDLDVAPAGLLAVGVVGTGIMGCGVAEVAARAGHSVVIQGRSRSSVVASVRTLESRLGTQVERGKLAATECEAILGRISATDDLAGLGKCDVVIESVVEDLAVKKEVFAGLDASLKAGALIATNTSTLPVVELAMATGRPEDVCGIHFFNPAPAMKLVEIVKPITASESTVERATTFARGCGKDAVVVEDRAGFVVNALLFPYLNDAVRLWEVGTASLEDIDAAMTGGCNFPMGPFALLDLVGLDTSVAILDALHADSRDPRHAAAVTLRRMVAAGRLGRKSGRGFYQYG